MEEFPTLLRLNNELFLECPLGVVGRVLRLANGEKLVLPRGVCPLALDEE